MGAATAAVALVLTGLGTLSIVTPNAEAGSSSSDLVIPVKEIQVDARTGEPLADDATASTSCTLVSKLVSGADIMTPTDQYGGVYCRLHSLVYEAGGVRLPLASFALDPADADGQTVRLTPLLPDRTLDGAQDDVTLTVPLASLQDDADASTPTLLMGYAPVDDYRRIWLQVAEGTDGSDVVVDGTPLTAGRRLDAFRGGVTGKGERLPEPSTDDKGDDMYRDVMVSVPRGTTLSWLREVWDEGSEGVPAWRDVDTGVYGRHWAPAVVEDLSTPERTIRVYRLTTHVRDTDRYQRISITATPADADSPALQHVEATTTRSTVTGAAGGGYSETREPFNCEGGSCDLKFEDGDQPPFFFRVSTSRDRDLARPLWERWGFGKLTHEVGQEQRDAGALISSPRDYPAPQALTKGQTPADKTQLFNVQRYAPTSWAGQGDAGGTYDFYVQYNGVPWGETGARSSFLGGVRLNGTWYSVPFPALPTAPLASHDETSCTRDGDSSCTSPYAAARAAMLGPRVDGSDVPGDQHYEDTSPLLQCELSQPNAYSPRVLSRRTITSGVNAGATITVSLVNARTQGDQLADGFSADASFRAHGTWDRRVDRRYRDHPAPAYGPATQMTNTSACYEVNREDYEDPRIGSRSEDEDSVERGRDAWNRWKTLYKITVTGVQDGSIHLDARYDGTDATTTSLTDPDAVLADAQALNTPKGGTAAWTSLIGEADDDPAVFQAGHLLDANGNVPESGNVKVTLKPGYINPVLTAATGRTDAGVTTADCGSDATCREVSRTASTDGGERGSLGGAVTYAWTPTLGAASEPVDEHTIATSVAEPMTITASLARVPVLTMAATDAGEPTGAASGAVVPEQWQGQELTPGSADMGAGRFITVTGAAPVPSSESLTFAGYKLVGATCGGAAAGETSGCAASNLEDLSAGRFFPGDTIDLDALRLTDQLNLANDALDGARYTALWLVPTFAAPGSGTDDGAAAATGAGVGRPNLPLYRVDELVEGDDGRFHRAGVYRQVAAAPGATLTLADEAFQASPAQLEGRSRVAERSRLAAVVPAPTRTEAAPAGTSGGTSVAPARAALLARTLGADHVAGSPGALTSGGAVLAAGTTPSLASTPALTGAEVSAGEGDGTDAAGADVVMADGEPADAQPARPLWIAYSCGAAMCGQRATLEASRAPIDAELTEGVTALADPAGEDGATLAGTLSGAENGVTVKRSGTGVVNLPGESATDQETAAARSATQLSASWTWADQPGQYTWDPWRCTVDGASGSGDGASVTGEAAAGADSGAAGAPPQDVTVALSTDATVRCGVVFHTSQVTLLVSGLENDATPGLSLTIPATEGGSAQSVYAPASGTTVDTLGTVSAADTTYVQPGRTYRLGGASWVGTRYLATWQRYTGDNPNDPETTDPSKWETVAGPDEVANVEPAADRHEVYRAVYSQAMLPRLPFTGASAQLYLFIGLLLAGVAAVTAPWARRRHA